MIEAPSPSAQSSTLVVIPDLPLTVYRAIVARCQADCPAERARIARGLDVLMTAEIRETDELGLYLVQSCQDSGLSYAATSWVCGCPDRQRHTEQRCKHSWALTILHAASAEAAYERAQTRYYLTAKGEAAVAARA
jgi:hypothetical protein